MNLDKINFSALAMMLLVGLFLALSSCEQAKPQGIAADVPQQCHDSAQFTGWVLLSYEAEVHAPTGLPGGYTVVVKTPHFLTQVVPISFKDSDETILGRLKSPWPDQFLIGQILPKYSLKRKYCKEQTKPEPKQLDDSVDEISDTPLQ